MFHLSIRLVIALTAVITFVGFTQSDAQNAAMLFTNMRVVGKFGLDHDLQRP